MLKRYQQHAYDRRIPECRDILSNFVENIFSYLTDTHPWFKPLPVSQRGKALESTVGD